MMRYAVLHADGRAVLRDGDMSLDVLNGIVGGYIECAPCPVPGITVWCNEDGKYENLPVNTLATRLCWDRLNDYDRYYGIVGDVAVTGAAGEDERSLTDDEVADLERRLGINFS